MDRRGRPAPERDGMRRSLFFASLNIAYCDIAHEKGGDANAGNRDGCGAAGFQPTEEKR